MEFIINVIFDKELLSNFDGGYYENTAITLIASRFNMYTLGLCGRHTCMCYGSDDAYLFLRLPQCNPESRYDH